MSVRCKRTRELVAMAVAALAAVACDPPPGPRAIPPDEATMSNAVSMYEPSALPGGTLDPTTIKKYVEPLVIPPMMPRASVINGPKGQKIDYYEIAVRQFEQFILPQMMGKKTTVWSYGAVSHPGTVDEGGTFNYPAFTIEARWKRPVRVSWRNELVQDPIDCFYAAGGPQKAGSCSFLPHLFAVDQTLHWANPPGDCRTGSSRPDCAGSSKSAYVGPVPEVVHVHGAHTTDDSDGYPEAWVLPDASDIPASIEFESGTFYKVFADAAAARLGRSWKRGEAVFDYPNDMAATTLWYHDHSLGMTRLNVYAGPAGFYLLRGGPGDQVTVLGKQGKPAKLPGPAPAKNDPNNLVYREIPLAIQGRSFNADGSLFYPDDRAFFEGLPPGGLAAIGVDTIPTNGSEVPPLWNPEFFANTMVVNGRTWPYLDVMKLRYRLRLLNGSQSRFLQLELVTATDPDDPATHNKITGAITQIGADGGFLPQPVALDRIPLGPAERADVIVDFGAMNLPDGAKVYLVNVGPDQPFGGGVSGVDFLRAHPGTTGQVMQFRLMATTANDGTTPPSQLALPAPERLNTAHRYRRVTLNEEESANQTVCVDDESLPVPITERPCPDGDTRSVCTDGTDYTVVDGDSCPAGSTKVEVTQQAFAPVAALLGTLSTSGNGIAKLWSDAISENPGKGDTEIWEIYNFTADAHPIHIHMVQFEVVNREDLEVDSDGVAVQPAVLLGTQHAPLPWERGRKDTVVALPGQVTRVKARFDIEGLFVWHCHVLEHEDNEMMRPYCVGTSPACAKHDAGAPH